MPKTENFLDFHAVIAELTKVGLKTKKLKKNMFLFELNRFFRTFAKIIRKPK